MSRNDYEDRPRGQAVTFAGVKAIFTGRTLDFSESLERANAIVPAKFAVCDRCEGTGVTSEHIEPGGGGFTSSEWHEMEAGDPDFAEDYFSGKYDRPCPECNGRNVVPVPIEEEADQEIMDLLWEAVKSETEYQAEKAHQQRYGY